MAETQKLDVLDQILDYKVVNIAGQPYEVRNPDALSPLDYRWIIRKYARINELEAIEDPSDAEKSEYSTILERMMRMVLNAPPEILSSLTDLQRTQIVLFFGRGSSKAQPVQQPSAASRKQMSGSRSHGKKRSRG